MKTIGVGFLARDPELTQVGETCVCEFTLGINERISVKDGTKDKVSWLPCVVWDSAAKTLHKYVKKGDKLYIEAIPRQESWEKNGEKRYKIVFRVTKFEFVTPKRDQSSLPSQENLDSAENTNVN